MLFYFLRMSFHDEGGQMISWHSWNRGRLYNSCVYNSKRTRHSVSNVGESKTKNRTELYSKKFPGSRMLT